MLKSTVDMGWSAGIFEVAQGTMSFTAGEDAASFEASREE